MRDPASVLIVEVSKIQRVVGGLTLDTLVLTSFAVSVMLVPEAAPRLFSHC